MVARVAALIRIDAIWLATQPVDMRAGADTLLARVVKVFGAARPHHAYLFANRKRHAEAAPTVQNSNSDSRSLTAARSKASGSKLPPHHSSSCSWSS
jgi:IS66 Orf2 like protein